MTNRVKKISQRGDTIVEVLFAMTIVGLVLGSSFGIANRSIALGQSAKERTGALKLAETQTELLKTLSKDDTVDVPEDPQDRFCVDSSYSLITISDTTDDCKKLNAEGNAGGLYDVSISARHLPDPLTGYIFKVSVTWTRFGAVSAVDQGEQDELTLYYRQGVL